MKTQEFIPGQRWISESESELGLGTVLKCENRQVTIVFMSCGETRLYSTETAPLTRVIFSKGDDIESHDTSILTVTGVEILDGLAFYHGLNQQGQTTTLPETSLSNSIVLNSPLDRLLTAQLDDNKWFDLRSETYKALQEQSHSATAGLAGARIELVPHQLFIANEVGHRHAPRVLLADEVGLGKTIEAGLIVHHQLIQEQIQRVLVVVPDALVHQWLVEMLRRFNLSFQIMDEEKYAAILEEDPTANPFLSSQLVLCRLSFLLTDPEIQAAAEQANWDTLIVDEAHHLQWSEEHISDEYTVIESLANNIPSLLLLTATPEQLGMEGHFARLRLLDPARFNDLSAFIKDGDRYQEIAELATPLHEGIALSDEQVTQLKESVGVDFISDEQWSELHGYADAQSERTRLKLLNRLIDQHGTGRILFRNTRHAISGFPKRHLHTYELDKDTESTPALLAWIDSFLKEIYPQKCLFICSDVHTVLNLFEGLRVQFGIHAAVFHEQMSIVERDRAAAWFSNPEENCQILISSEIGSEGRNFQFLHHLVLHELPKNADLLEQRIGRLDRIGQKSDIEIHVPYQPNSHDHLLSTWYHQGLNAFEQTCAVGSQVVETLRDDFEQVIDNAQQDDAFHALVENAKQLAEEKNLALENGRDKLLELNSNQPDIVQPLVEQLDAADADWALEDYLLSLFDCFGVDSEEQSNRCWIVRPGRHMAVSHFPGIPDEGVTITFDRHVATAREDVEFISWDHPMIIGAMDMVTSNPYGQASLAIIESQKLPHGSLFVECLYRTQCSAQAKLKIDRYLPIQTLRFVINERTVDVSEGFTPEAIAKVLHPADKSQMRTFIKNRSKDIEKLVKHSQTLAIDALPNIKASATRNITQELDDEINRLSELQKYNPLIRDEEIQTLEARKEELLHAMKGLVEQLVGIRVLVNIH